MDRYIASRYEDFLQDLETVVNIDSGSRYLPGIEQVAQFFADRFAALNWHTQIHRFSDEYGACLEASNVAPSADASFDLLCVGHMDTVFPKGTVQKRPFSMQGERAMGPGITDMKAGLVAALHLAETLQHVVLTDNLSLCVAFNGDEEVGSPSSRQWIEQLARQSKCVFIFEPGRPDGEFVLQRKGVGMYQVRCYGKAAHAGVEPHKGINAIVELAHQILKIDTFERVEAGTTVNVDVVTGGTKTNVIPDMATAAIDVRVMTAREAERIEYLFHDLPRHTTVEGVKVDVIGGVNRPPMEPSEDTWAVWEQMRQIGNAQGMELELLVSGGGSDGNFTAAAGTPTIDACGPVGGSVHSADEYLELTSIVPRMQLICQMCQHLADTR